MEEKHEKKTAAKGEGTETKKSSANLHAPQKVAYPSEHNPKEGKWLRLARERAKEK